MRCYYSNILIFIILIYYNIITQTNSISNNNNNIENNNHVHNNIPSFINKTTYTIHRVTGLMENIAFKRHIRHVDFTAAIIKLKLNQQVYLEDFYGKQENLPTETPLSKTNIVNITTNKKVREKNLGVSGTMSLECQLKGDSKLIIPTYSDLFDDFKGKETTPPWHLISLPHGTKAVYGLTSSIINLLERQNPTILKEIKGLGETNTTDTLYFALLLRYRDHHGTDMTSKIILDNHHNNYNDINRFALNKCFLNILSPSKQKLWPTKNFVDATTGDILYGQSGNLINERKRKRKTMKTISILSRHVIPENFAKSNKNLLNKYPRIKNSWHPIVPHMPHYCGLANGSLLESQTLALRAKHEMAFIQTRNKKEQPIPELPELVLQFLHAFIPGLINNFLRQDTSRTAQVLSDQVPGDVLSNVPEDEIELLAQPLVHNVVSLLTDALHHTVVESISTELGMQLGPKMAEVITQNIIPKMANQIVPTLQQAIPEKVNKVVPYLMERALPIKLNKLLTLTVTHALVPTLTTALTRTPDQDIWCHLCYYKHKHCNYCHDSPQSEYYNNYYSAYYSDYYSTYYEKYYTDALESIENLQHPPSFQGAAKAANMGIAPAGTDSEITPEAYDTPDRAVTASGTKESEVQLGHDEFSGNVDLHGR